MHYVELETEPDHDAHNYDQELGDFDNCVAVIVHCETEDEAREVAQTVHDNFPQKE